MIKKQKQKIAINANFVRLQIKGKYKIRWVLLGKARHRQDTMDLILCVVVGWLYLILVRRYEWYGCIIDDGMVL